MLIVMYVVGGPVQFVNLVGQWTEQAIGSIGTCGQTPVEPIDFPGGHDERNSSAVRHPRAAVVVEWFEAVALRSGNHRGILATAWRPQRPGPASDRAAAPTGRSISRAPSETTEPVRRLGQLLQALLAQSEPPVQLRLMVSQATAPEP